MACCGNQRNSFKNKVLLAKSAQKKANPISISVVTSNTVSKTTSAIVEKPKSLEELLKKRKEDRLIRIENRNKRIAARNKRLL